MEKRSHNLSDFERFVLQALVCLRSNAYGMTVRREVEERVGRNVGIGAVYVALECLEKRGLVSSRTGETAPERGGRAKRYYKIEAPGQRVFHGPRLGHGSMWRYLAPAGC